MGAPERDQRPAQRPAARGYGDIVKALKAGSWSLLDLIIADPRLHGPSRLALWMERVSRDSGRFYQTPANLAIVLNADRDEVSRWLARVCRWGLFRKDGQIYTRRALTKAEQDAAKAFNRQLHDQGHKVTIAAFKLVTQRRIRAEVAVLSVIRDLTEYVDDDGKAGPRPMPATHTNQQFVDQLQRSWMTVSTALNQAVDLGYTERFGGGTGGGRRRGVMRVRKSTWYRPDHLLLDDKNSQRAGERLHVATHKRRSKSGDNDMVDPVDGVDVDPVTKPIRRLPKPVTKPVRQPGWDDADDADA